MRANHPELNNRAQGWLNFLYQKATTPDDWEKSWRNNNESHPLVNQWRFMGLGLCVDDLESASRYYSSLGFTKLKDRFYRKEWKTDSLEYSLGGILFELMKPEELSIYTDSIKQCGEGVAEIIFEVSDIENEINMLNAKGAQILIVSDTDKMATIQTGLKGNILTRLIQK